MTKKPVLVIMAAGMGSRYGGLKQIDPVGRHGEAILDYSLYDAHKAGFETAVIIIKEAIREDFMSTVGKRLEHAPMEIRYAFQEFSRVPQGCSVPADRVKPLGTAHAIVCAAEAIDGAPFAVINADDYYGRAAFDTIYRALSNPNSGPQDYYMVGYLLKNTLSEHGGVSRGICQVDENGYLQSLVEGVGIERYGDVARLPLEDGSWQELSLDTLVSMNLFGFAPGLLQELNDQFPHFLSCDLPNNPLKAEFFLPGEVGRLMAEGKANVRVLSSADRWYGVTYAGDKPLVTAAIDRLTAEGLYPDGLWKK